MHESTADPAELGLSSAGIDFPAWKKAIGGTAAILLAIVFFASGCWKLTDPSQWSQVLSEFRVPSNLALPFTLALGIGETFSAVLILVPRFRKWGSALIALMLILFMAYIALNYSTLAGKDCSCFPLVKRSIGPGFFVGDMVMVLMAGLAGAWVRKSENIRAALVVLGAVLVFAGVAFGVNAARQGGLKAPAYIEVDGKPFSLEQGEIFLFFYDPECLHCEIAIPTHYPQFAGSFLRDTGLQAATSYEVAPLRNVFKFVDPPYGVALEHGRQKAAIVSFEENEPAETLRRIGFVE